jgi:hypothetical protein
MSPGFSYATVLIHRYGVESEVRTASTILLCCQCVKRSLAFFNSSSVRLFFTKDLAKR